MHRSSDPSATPTSGKHLVDSQVVARSWQRSQHYGLCQRDKLLFEAPLVASGKQIAERDRLLLDCAMPEMQQLHAQIDNAEQDFAEREKALVAKVVDKKNKELDTLRDEIDEMRAQNDNLKNTLQTLNGIFKNMRQDNDMLREADLREANMRLQQLLK